MVITKGFGPNKNRTEARKNGPIRAKMERKAVIGAAGGGRPASRAVCYHNIINRSIIGTLEPVPALRSLRKRSKQANSVAFTDWMHHAAKNSEASERLC